MERPIAVFHPAHLVIKYSGDQIAAYVPVGCLDGPAESVLEFIGGGEIAGRNQGAGFDVPGRRAVVIICQHLPSVRKILLNHAAEPVQGDVTAVSIGVPGLGDDSVTVVDDLVLGNMAQRVGLGYGVGMADGIISGSGGVAHCIRLGNEVSVGIILKLRMGIGSAVQPVPDIGQVACSAFVGVIGCRLRHPGRRGAVPFIDSFLRVFPKPVAVTIVEYIGCANGWAVRTLDGFA